MTWERDASIQDIGRIAETADRLGYHHLTCAEHIGTGGHGTLSLLRGNEPYKQHWRPEPVANQRLLLARRRTAPLLSAALCDAAAPQRGKTVLHRWKELVGGGGP